MRIPAERLWKKTDWDFFFFKWVMGKKRKEKKKKNIWKLSANQVAGFFFSSGRFEESCTAESEMLLVWQTSVSGRGEKCLLDIRDGIDPRASLF